MGIKLHQFGESIPERTVLVFHCPGCKCGHPITVPRWTWNGSMEKPTFHPSLFVNQHDLLSCCHSFVKNGMIEFLPGVTNCYHALAGKTVEIPDWDDVVVQADCEARHVI